jgi:hypothetical protein
MNNKSIPVFIPYPFVIGEEIYIDQGPRRGNWTVTACGDKKVTLRCPVSGREFCWDRFCYFVENRNPVAP